MNRTPLFVSIAAMTLGLSSFSAMAQNAPADGRDGGGRMAREMGRGNFERNLDELNLTDDQKKQVEPILQDMREKMRAATQDAQEKLSKVLTEEQRTKMRELMRERRDAAGPTTQQSFNPMERLQREVQRLELTDDQKTKIKDIFAKFRPELDSIRTEAAGDRQAMMERMRPLLQDLRSQVTAVLTPEQTQKLQEDVKDWREGAGNRAGGDRPAGEKRHGGTIKQ